jgi:hypothetical protein
MTNKLNQLNQLAQERMILATLLKRGNQSPEELRAHYALNAEGVDRSLIRLSLLGFISWSGDTVELHAVPFEFGLICPDSDSVFTSERTLLMDILVDHFLTVLELDEPLVVHPRDAYAGPFAPTTVKMWPTVYSELLDFGLEGLVHPSARYVVNRFDNDSTGVLG